VITSIGTVKGPDDQFTPSDGGSGKVTMSLRQEFSTSSAARRQLFGCVHRVL